jgi:hypothetical protein
MGEVRGDAVLAQWVVPRTGEYEGIGAFETGGEHEFDPPGEPRRGSDWVLVLEACEDEGNDDSRDETNEHRPVLSTFRHRYEHNKGAPRWSVLNPRHTRTGLLAGAPGLSELK